LSGRLLRRLFSKDYKSRYLPRSGLLEQITPADGLQPPLISVVMGQCIAQKGGLIMGIKLLLALLLLIFSAVGLFTTFALSGDVPMMTKDELKAMLGNPDLVIFDGVVKSTKSVTPAKAGVQNPLK
jgi:hypothetical protein